MDHFGPFWTIVYQFVQPEMGLAMALFFVQSPYESFWRLKECVACSPRSKWGAKDKWNAQDNWNAQETWSSKAGRVLGRSRIDIEGSNFRIASHSNGDIAGEISMVKPPVFFVNFLVV